MATVMIDANNQDNFQARAFKIMPRAVYTFEIAKPLHVEGAKSSANQIIKVELKCIDDGEFKATTVFDNIALTQKAEFKLVHLALAAGTQTSDDIKARGVDLDVLCGKIIKAEIGIEPASRDKLTGKTYPEKNRVIQYLFDAVKTV